MKGIVSLKEIAEVFKTDKGLKAVMIIGAALILIIALSGIWSGGKKEEAASSTAELAEYEAGLEKRLADILSGIDGIGKIRVMVTLDTAEKTEYGRNSDMIESVTAPTVRGVIVICDGGDSIVIKEKVINAVTGVFGISSTRVSVAK